MNKEVSIESAEQLQLLSLQDVEAFCRVKRAAARRLMRDVGVMKLNGRLRVRRADLVDFLQRAAKETQR